MQLSKRLLLQRLEDGSFILIDGTEEVVFDEKEARSLVSGLLHYIEPKYLGLLPVVKEDK